MSWRRLHSPTLFLWGRALQSNPKHWPETCRELSWRVDPSLIEAWRAALKRNPTWMSRTDLGAGQRRTGLKKNTLQVSELARRSLTPEQDVLAICRWLKCLKPKGRFLELGTSLGVTTAYVASAGWEVETWEGCNETLNVAREGWKCLSLDDVISAKHGSFQSLLVNLPSAVRWDVVYLDGCHKGDVTKELVDALEKHVETAIVVDDIAWSGDMHRTWLELQDDPAWRVTFSWRGRGVLVKANHMSSEHYRLA